MDTKQKEPKAESNPFFGRKYIRAVGRRKTSSAAVQLYVKGKGNFFVNKKPALEYFGSDSMISICTVPLLKIGKNDSCDINAKVAGGGKKSQSEAIRLALARALVSHNEELKSQMRALGFLTVNRRVKERKKPGLKRARRAPQWSKR